MMICWKQRCASNANLVVWTVRHISIHAMSSEPCCLLVIAWLGHTSECLFLAHSLALPTLTDTEYAETGCDNSSVSPFADQFADTEGTTIFVKGFDKYLGEEAIRQQLTETFAECGAVSTVRLPTDRESGELKGIGFIEFGSVEAKVCTAVQLPLACLSFLHVCMFVLAGPLQSCVQHGSLQLCL